jgi:hypothetical protein
MHGELIMRCNTFVEILTKGDHLGELGIDWKMYIKMDLEKKVLAWTVYNWLRIGSSGRIW